MRRMKTDAALGPWHAKALGRNASAVDFKENALYREVNGASTLICNDKN